MSNIYGGDEVNALVLEVGSHSTKAGYAGDDAPKAVFPSHVGILPADKDKPGAMEVDGAAGQVNRRLLVGQNAVNIRKDDMEIGNPFNPTDAEVADWDMVEALWSHAFKERLRAEPQEYAILMAEPNSWSKATREKAVELMFSKYQVPALFLAKNAALSAFATARQTALVVDAGYQATTVTAVHDGYVLNKSITVNPVGGKLLNTLQQKILEAKPVRLLPRYSFKRVEVAPGELKTEELSFPKTTPSYHTIQVEQLVAEVREATSRVHDSPFDEQIHSRLPTTIYELPDGTEIMMGADRLKVPEVYFQPHLLTAFKGFNPDTHPGLKRGEGAGVVSLPASALECVNKCDTDVKRDLLQGVVLTGGVASTGGFRERLEKELTEQAPQAPRLKVIMATNTIERRFSVWIGGSILASLGSFQQMWISKKEYEEYGASIVHRKAP